MTDKQREQLLKLDPEKRGRNLALLESERNKEDAAKAEAEAEAIPQGALNWLGSPSRVPYGRLGKKASKQITELKVTWKDPLTGELNTEDFTIAEIWEANDDYRAFLQTYVTQKIAKKGIQSATVMGNLAARSFQTYKEWIAAGRPTNMDDIWYWENYGKAGKTATTQAKEIKPQQPKGETVRGDTFNGKTLKTRRIT